MRLASGFSGEGTVGRGTREEGVHRGGGRDNTRNDISMGPRPASTRRRVDDRCGASDPADSAAIARFRIKQHGPGIQDSHGMSQHKSNSFLSGANLISLLEIGRGDFSAVVL